MASEERPVSACGAARGRCAQSFQDVTSRVRETFHTNIRDRFRASMSKAGSKKASKNAASVATGLVAARVFKGNLVLARMAQSTCAKFSGAGYSAQGGSTERGRKAGKALAVAIAAAGGSVAVQEPVHAEAVQVDATIASRVSEVYSSIKGGQKQKEKAEVSLQGKDSILEKRQRIEELEGDASPLQKGLQAVVLPVMATLSKAFMLGLNNTEIYGAEKLAHAIRGRSPGQALVTVCNHVAAMDDPLVLAAVVPEHLILDAHPMRWTLCATDRCFKNPAMAAFFRAVKVLPVERGAGLEQKGMESALAKLDRGEWVHLFPEGSRSRDGGKTIQPIKRGVGRLVAEARKPPLVLPFVHLGMAGVIPRGAKMISGGNDIAVLVGDPVPVVDLIAAAADVGATQTQLYDAIAARVGVVLIAMKAQLEALAKESAAIRADLESIGPALVDVIEWEEDVNFGILQKALLREKREGELQAAQVERTASGAAAGPPPFNFENAETVFGKRERGEKGARGKASGREMNGNGVEVKGNGVETAGSEEPVDSYAGWTSLDEESAARRALEASIASQGDARQSMVGFAAQALFKVRERGREMVPEGWRGEKGWRDGQPGVRPRGEPKLGRVRSFLREVKNEPRLEEVRTFMRELKSEPRYEGLRKQLGGLSTRVNDHFGSSMQ